MNVLYGGKVAEADLKKNYIEGRQTNFTSLAMPKDLKFGKTNI